MGGSPVNDSYLGKDIAIPKHPFPRGKLPTVVFVHGGSWQRGDKSGLFNEKIADAFAEDGFVGISVNYRLSPEVQYPKQTQDLATAIKWLLENTHKYGGSVENVFLIGHSAGAHLMMDLLSNPSYLEEEGILNLAQASIRGIVGISGVYNIVRMANAPIYGSLVVNPGFGERAEKWREASIVPTLSRYGQKAPVVKIPLLLINAEDDFHLQEDSKEVEACLKKAGHNDLSVQNIPERNHFSIVRELSRSSDDPTRRLLNKFVHDKKQK